MNKRTGFVIYLISFCFAVVIPGIPLWAEDEDLDSTVYIVFDPETGELITVQEPSSARRKHSLTNVAPSQGTQDPTADSAESEPVSLILAGFLALGLMGGAIVWIRKSRKLS